MKQFQRWSTVLAVLVAVSCGGLYAQTSAQEPPDTNTSPAAPRPSPRHGREVFSLRLSPDDIAEIRFRTGGARTDEDIDVVVRPNEAGFVCNGRAIDPEVVRSLINSLNHAHEYSRPSAAGYFGVTVDEIGASVEPGIRWATEQFEGAELDEGVLAAWRSEGVKKLDDHIELLLQMSGLGPGRGYKLTVGCGDRRIVATSQADWPGALPWRVEEAGRWYNTYSIGVSRRLRALLQSCGVAGDLSRLDHENEPTGAVGMMVLGELNRSQLSNNLNKSLGYHDHFGLDVGLSPVGLAFDIPWPRLQDPTEQPSDIHRRVTLGYLVDSRITVTLEVALRGTELVGEAPPVETLLARINEVQSLPFITRALEFGGSRLNIDWDRAKEMGTEGLFFSVSIRWQEAKTKHYYNFDGRVGSFGSYPCIITHASYSDDLGILDSGNVQMLTESEELFEQVVEQMVAQGSNEDEVRKKFGDTVGRTAAYERRRSLYIPPGKTCVADSGGMLRYVDKEALPEGRQDRPIWVIVLLAASVLVAIVCPFLIGMRARSRQQFGINPPKPL